MALLCDSQHNTEPQRAAQEFIFLIKQAPINYFTLNHSRICYTSTAVMERSPSLAFDNELSSAVDYLNFQPNLHGMADLGSCLQGLY